MSITREITRDCRQRGCRILWTVRNSGEGIDVDHCTKTMSGSSVYVERFFPGAIILEADGKHHGWSPEQAAAIDAWRQQLHRMPLEEIP